MVLVLVTVSLAPAVAGWVNALPGFSDHIGPSELTVTEFERTGSGCGPVNSRGVDSLYDRHGSIQVADTDADLSVRVERTSIPGADLSRFRVHVESVHEGAVESSCERPTVGYRVVREPSGGSPEGLLPDAHGVQVASVENGEFAGCSGAYTGIDPAAVGQCGESVGEEPLTWANATATATPSA